MKVTSGHQVSVFFGSVPLGADDARRPTRQLYLTALRAKSQAHWH
jgi:hypothetical protein